MKNLIIMISLSLLIFSCSAERRLQRLIKNNPELVRDTSIIDVDTTFVHIEGVRTDSTVLLSSYTHDTLIIEKERLTIKTIYDHHTDSLYIFGECDDIDTTIIKTETIRVPYIINKEALPWKMLLLIASVILGSVWIYNKFIKKKS